MAELITPRVAIGMLTLLTIVVLILEIQCARMMDDVADIFRKLKALTDWVTTQQNEIDRIAVEVNVLRRQTQAVRDPVPYDTTRQGGKR